MKNSKLKKSDTKSQGFFHLVPQSPGGGVVVVAVLAGVVGTAGVVVVGV